MKKAKEPLPPLEPPDFYALFHARLLRLASHLEQTFGEDLERLIAVPIEEDSARQQQWTHRLIKERSANNRFRMVWICAPDETHGLKLPLTIGEGLRLVKEGLETDAKMMADQVKISFLLLEDKVRDSIIARPVLPAYWPRLSILHSRCSFALHGLTAACAVLPEPELRPSQDMLYFHETHQMISIYWPHQVAPSDVTQWFAGALNRVKPGYGDQLRTQMEKDNPPDVILLPFGKTQRAIPLGALAALYFAHIDVQEGQKRKSMAVDAGHKHTALLTGWRNNPQDGRRHRAQRTSQRIVTENKISRVDILTNGQPVQLQLDIAALDNVHDSTIIALRRLRGSEGLRNWAAMLKLFSVEGGRRGTYRWIMDEHMRALGYDERQRRDPDVQANVATIIEFFASLELAVYGDDGKLRERRKMLLETGRFERLVGSEWKLEGLEFQINTNLYSGVRAPNGEIGHNWMPAPVELAQIDHARYPYAHSLGMLLAIRFRWRLNEQADHLTLSGANLLKLAGIEYESRRASEAWEKIRRTLDVLVEVKQLQEYEWQTPGEPWTLDTMCLLRSAYWITDRAARGLIPEEKPVDADRPITGAELKSWREKRGLSQNQLSTRLRIDQSAVSRAEAKPSEPLGYKLKALFLADKDKEAPDGSGEAESSDDASATKKRSL